MKNFALPLTLLLGAATLLALQPAPTLNCNDRGRNNRNNRLASHCEMREQTIGAAGGVISVDGNQNFGIAIKGWDRNEILVRTQVQTSAPTDAEAQDLARQVTVQTAGAQIRADGPASDRDRQWSVSYEVFVPARSSLNLRTVNGGVSVSDVVGDVQFQAVNGGVSLKRVGGNVKGHTTNGGLSIELAGDRWEGSGMDVATTNGGVSLKVPRNYSAQLEAGTTNGGVSNEFQVSPQVRLERRERHISTAIGAGGALLKLTTTNGGVSIKQI